MGLSGIFVVPAQDQTMSGKLGKRNLSQWNEGEGHGTHARHVHIGIPGLQYPHLFTRLPWWDVVVCAPASDEHAQLTMLTRKFNDELNTTHVKCLILRNHSCPPSELPDDSPIQGQHRLSNQVPQKQIIVVWRE
jgi:hypothetical protein